MTVRTDEVETKGEVKYLGVTVDTKMTFWPHVHQTAQKAAERIASSSRLMGNTNGPRPGKRRLPMSTVNSILLYSAEIWADSLKTQKYCHAITTRGFGDVNLDVTQLLTGRGYFRRYLHNLNRVRTSNLTYCGHERDDAEHTFFECNRWTELRQRLEAVVEGITPDKIVRVMLHSTERWQLVATYTETILRRKNADGCLT
ncbi:uncharacterized protein LOC124309088 [Neodiprion virginianus]|uniref:uncharacterized protein LOC124309088 n=1 Tax=Neodiprion virginianus TaxID=2961670 RepID=UPI001EE75D22|nr:uncharacterized protein LOC124309088 [Neodiprion virginianus]